MTAVVIIIAIVIINVLIRVINICIIIRPGLEGEHALALDAWLIAAGVLVHEVSEGVPVTTRGYDSE